MSAPKKPDYARLRKIAEQVTFGVKGWREAFIGLIDRAEWLEEQRSGVKTKTVEVRAHSEIGGKRYSGPDFKKGGKKN